MRDKSISAWRCSTHRFLWDLTSRVVLLAFNDYLAKSVPPSEFLFLHPPLMPKRELQEIPHLFPADTIACHERVDRILNIARREYPLPADSRRVEGLQDERLQCGPHPIGQRNGESMLWPFHKLRRDIFVEYFSEDILGRS